MFYDRETLRFIEGWTRADGKDAVFLVDRGGAFARIRADGRRRAREFDEYVRRRFAGDRRAEMPLYMIDPSLHTAPLAARSPGDWDDLMIEQLIDAARRVAIQPERDQWAEIRRLFDAAEQDARNAGQKTGREFAALFVLDRFNPVGATLAMLRATNVRMIGNHADIPLGRVPGTTHRVPPDITVDDGRRVIGNIHTHVWLDPLIDRTSTAVGMRDRSTVTSLHSGVSDVDVSSATNDQLVVYAIDSKYLHRANPDGTKNDKLPRSGNVLREALRIFGREPR